MIMSKTPYRISLFGGGSDYPAWYRENEGATIGGAINKYNYISVHQLPSFFDHKFRLVYSKTELKDDIESIEHPSIRAILKHKKIDSDLEVHHIGDLPAMSGIGSSSSFSCGLLNAINFMQNNQKSPHELGLETIHVEQELMQEAVGSQDQMFAAHGGFNSIKFSGDNIAVDRIDNFEKIKELEDKLMLVFTGKSRSSTVNAKKIINNLGNNRDNIKGLVALAKHAKDVLSNNKDISLIGEMLAESWERKKQLADTIIIPEIADLYNQALKSGAKGGKVLGAGGGGFVLLYADEDKQNKIKQDLSKYKFVDFKFTPKPSRIILHHPHKISDTKQELP